MLKRVYTKLLTDPILKLHMAYKNFSDNRFHTIIALSAYFYIFYGLVLIILRYISETATDFLTLNYINFLSFALVGALGALLNLYIKGIGGEKDFYFRFLIAVVFPVVFISLFYIEGDKIIGISSVNLLMFTCGFSSDFILLFLNKIVEVSKRVINLDVKDEKLK